VSFKLKCGCLIAVRALRRSKYTGLSTSLFEFKLKFTDFGTGITHPDSGRPVNMFSTLSYWSSGQRIMGSPEVSLLIAPARSLMDVELGILKVKVSVKYH
jgi:hypothetical protein